MPLSATTGIGIARRNRRDLRWKILLVLVPGVAFCLPSLWVALLDVRLLPFGHMLFGRALVRVRGGAARAAMPAADGPGFVDLRVRPGLKLRGPRRNVLRAGGAGGI